MHFTAFCLGGPFFSGHGVEFGDAIYYIATLKQDTRSFVITFPNMEAFRYRILFIRNKMSAHCMIDLILFGTDTFLQWDTSYVVKFYIMYRN